MMEKAGKERRGFHLSTLTIHLLFIGKKKKQGWEEQKDDSLRGHCITFFAPFDRIDMDMTI